MKPYEEIANCRKPISRYKIQNYCIFHLQLTVPIWLKINALSNNYICMLMGILYKDIISDNKNSGRELYISRVFLWYWNYTDIETEDVNGKSHSTTKKISLKMYSKGNDKEIKTVYYNNWSLRQGNKIDELLINLTEEEIE